MAQQSYYWAYESESQVIQMCLSLCYPGQNNCVGSHRIFPTQGSNPGLPYCGRILYQLSHREAQEYWSGQPIPSPVDLPNPGIKPGLLNCRQNLYQLSYVLSHWACTQKTIIQKDTCSPIFIAALYNCQDMQATQMFTRLGEWVKEL